MTPREVFERLIDGVTSGDWDALPALYAEDTVVVHPMAESDEPLVGREALRRHFAAAAALPLRMSARDVVVHETADPEAVIAEFEYAGRVTTTGRRFTVRNVFVLRVRDGLIVESRDYADHLRFGAAIGRPPGPPTVGVDGASS
ncbi:nuclear transport factor 2 family protein [Actinoallomurus purpureus]|uniref:nuclear transport factor 2 family protein n=1 Tax=Actinoallomurus purpureus TaxID=478114 RepID=UPI002092755B|nr:nuclear transport factor 2 family protein [Actinoallomurus purpureus]MCO6010657.1 nuclear transport factor 2 family protein [Actinoallomurus purpureus]